MIRIDAKSQGLIGDALCAVPYMKYLCEKHDCSAYIDGLNKFVRPLLVDYPFVYEHPGDPGLESFDMDLSSAWQLDLRNNWAWHMTQVYFAYYGAPVPPLPVCYPMHTESCGLEPGIVITPFSRTNAPDNNKLWPHDRWLALIDAMLFKGYTQRIYVVGSAADERDFRTYAGVSGVELVCDRPLPQILDLLRKSTLVLGLDNGISHLCHVGGVSHHVMIYADCLPRLLAENPLGVHVRGAMPASIGVSEVMAAAESVIRGER